MAKKMFSYTITQPVTVPPTVKQDFFNVNYKAEGLINDISNDLQKCIDSISDCEKIYKKLINSKGLVGSASQAVSELNANTKTYAKAAQSRKNGLKKRYDEDMKALFWQAMDELAKLKEENAKLAASAEADSSSI